MDLEDDQVKHKETGSRDIIDLYEALFNEYGWGYEEILEIPIPAFLEIIGALKRRKEKEKKAYENVKNKSKRKGR